MVPEPSTDDARAAAALARTVAGRVAADRLGAALVAAGLADEGLPWAVLLEAAREAGRASCAGGLAAYEAFGPLGAAAVLCGAGEAAAELGMAYAGTRVVFGRPLARMPVQRAAFAAVAASVEAAVALVRRVASFRDGAGAAALDEGAVLPYALGAAWAAAEAALQVHGGYGYTDDYPVSRVWREVAAARAAYAAVL